MNLNIALGSGGALWLISCTPQAIFNIFFRNYLGAQDLQLGLLVAIVQISAVFNLISVPLFSKASRRKLGFVVFYTIHRLSGFVLAFVAYRSGVAAIEGVTIVFIAMSVSTAMMNAGTAGWWEWMADLFPEKTRARFFGKRSAVLNAVNISWFFLVTLLLDFVAGDRALLFFAVVFGFSGLAGVLDVLGYIFVPNPKRGEEQPAPIFAPLKDANFIVFSVAVGFYLFATNIFAPFLAPYLTDPAAVGIPAGWIGVTYVVSQLTWIAVAPAWGLIMDRYGRKPAVVLGGFYAFSWIGYLFISHGNYMYLIPVIAAAGGLFAPAFWDGANQMMLTLTPRTNRISYISWYLTIVGCVSAGGGLLGGYLLETWSGVEIVLGENLVFGGFHIVLLLTIAMIVLAIVVLGLTREGTRAPFGFVATTIVRPGIFRTFHNMGIIASSTRSHRAAGALRSVKGAADHIVLDDIVDRLHDPDRDVREEAARALGRIGSPDAVDVLIREIRDTTSSVRPAAARALGHIGDRRGIPVLVEGLEDSSEDLQEACAGALGSFADEEAVSRLLRLFRETRSDRVFASGAEAASKLGIIETAWDIFPRMHRTTNPVLRNQLAISMGNLIGRPGDFYRFITGNEQQRSARTTRLFGEVQQRLAGILAPERHEKARNTAGQMISTFRRIRYLFDEEEYREACELLLDFCDEIIRTILGKEGARTGGAFDTAFDMDPRLGIWVWMLSEIRRRVDRADSWSLRTDILLIIYFLRVRELRRLREITPNPAAGT